MMKIIKAYFSILILAFFPSWVLAQKNGKDSLGLIIKWTPSSLITPETPTVQFGVELLLPKFTKYGSSIQFDYGFQVAPIFDYYSSLAFLQLDLENISNKSYRKYHVEFRKYYKSVKKKILNFPLEGRSYIAFEGFYTPYTYLQKNGRYVIKNDDLGYSFDYASVSKNTVGFDVKAGYVVMFNFPLSVEGFLGFGLRTVNRTYSDFVNKKIGNGYSYNYDSRNKEGVSISPHLALGIRIGYKIL